MRKTFAFTLVASLLVLAVAIAYAETRTHEYTEIHFGADFHKSVGVHLNNLRAVWDADGLKQVTYFLTPWKGKIVYKDMLVVNGENTIYRRSEDRKLNVEMHYQLTAEKFYRDEAFMTKPVKPFDMENGQIWWIFEYEEDGAKKMAVVIWTMKTNEITWKPYKG